MTSWAGTSLIPKNDDGDDDEYKSTNVESDVQSNDKHEEGEPRQITRGKTPRQLYNIHGSNAQGINPNKTKKIQTLIRGKSKEQNGESPTQ